MGKASNKQRLTYVAGAVAILIAFLLLGGDQWLNRMLNNGNTSFMDNWNWTQIIIGIAIGFGIGLLVAKRKW
jgi:uncharacterized membrane protein